MFQSLINIKHRYIFYNLQAYLIIFNKIVKTTPVSAKIKSGGLAKKKQDHNDPALSFL